MHVRAAHMKNYPLMYMYMMYVHKFNILHNKCGTKYGKQGIKLLRRQIERERESQKMKQLAINNASLGVPLTSIITNLF